MKAILFQLVRRLASDPRVQAKARETATQILHRAKPTAQAAAAELRAAAREVDPRQDPKGFVRRLKKGWDDRNRA